MNCHPSIKLVIVVLAIGVGSVQSVINAPRLLPSQPDPPVVRLFNDPRIEPIDFSYILQETPPYMLTILEGETIDVATNSTAALTVNLNRPLLMDINITVTVYSRPDLISFESNSKKSKTIINYKANTFGDRVVKFYTTSTPGHAEIVCSIDDKLKDIVVDYTTAFSSINISRSTTLNVIISVVGWLYFLAWSTSFYFQVILNYQRKSVVGLDFNFTALNLLGFTFYSIYNFALMFDREVQQDYYNRYAYSRLPVEYNDLFFSVHAFLLTFVTVIQCFIYERGQQTISILASAFIGLTSLVGIGLFVTHLFNGLSILDVVLYLSYVKLAITVIKYTPQAYMNFQRKATTGWSIHNILLDFTGGILSLAQMFFLAYNFNDWSSIFGNFTKFGLGLVSMSCDILFMIQHYILYKQPAQLEDSHDSIPSPVISQSIRSSTYMPQPYDQQESSDENEGTNGDPDA